MNNKPILITLLIFFVAVCICPLAIALLFLIGESLDSQSGLTTFFLLALCAIPLVLAIAGFVWQIRHILSSPKAGRRLAGELDLEPLNEASKEMGIWYGGQFDKRPIALKPYGSPYRYYAAERSRTGVRFYLRLVMAVNVPEPLGVVVTRGTQRASRNPTSFHDAFDLENAAYLTPEVQEALFAFVAKGYPTGITGVTLRFSKGFRNLRLCDRATAPEGLLGDEVMPEATVILVHDHPDTTIKKEAVQYLFNDLATLAYKIEAQVDNSSLPPKVT